MEHEDERDTATSRMAQSGQEMFAMAVNAAMAAKERAEGMSADMLEQLNLPSPQDVKRLRTVAERTERIEDALTAIVERLDRIESRLSGEAAPPPRRSTPRSPESPATDG